METPKFCLVVDTEADFWKYIPSPHFKKLDVLKWRLNKILSGFRYSKNREGLKNIVKSFKKYEFPVTFTIVGHLYLKNCKGFPHFNEITPKGSWMKKSLNKNWSYWDPKSSYKKYPGLYLGDFIEEEMNEKYFDLGLHSFTHESCTLEKKEVLESIFKSAMLSAKSLGIKPVSFGAPFNMIEDESEPSKVYNALRKNGIKIIRFGGVDRGLKNKHKVGLKEVFKKSGLKAIQVSRYFEGNSKKELIDKIIKEVERLPKKDVIYCLNTHDFTHKNTKNLDRILKKVKSLERGKKLEIINMRQLSKK